MPSMFSSADFQAVMGIAVTNAMYEVLERCYRELQKEIQQDIYSAYSPQDYARTGDLLTAWKREWHRLSTELSFDPRLMTLNPSNWQHGSLYDGYTDVRDVLIDILAGGYRAYNAHKGKPIPARPMWDKFIAKVDAHFYKWMRAALRRQGLTVV